jgi:flagellar biosynthesis protein FlhF
MNVKNYRGKTAEECMQKLKADMGRDAVILQSRTIKPLFGMFGPTVHEIVAAGDASTILDAFGERAASRSAERQAPAPPSRLPVSAAYPNVPQSVTLRPGRKLSLAEAAELAESSPEGRAAAFAAISQSVSAMEGDRVAELERQLAQLTEKVVNSAPVEARPQPEPPAPSAAAGLPTSVGSFLRYRVPAAPVGNTDTSAAPQAPVAAPAANAQSDPYRALFDQLRDSQVSEVILRRLRTEMPAGLTIDEARSELHDRLVRRLLVSGAISPTAGKMTLAAVIGPTGIGKTTTIAKLAASLSLTAGASVGMVTLDTSRVAGTQQLLTYGQILEIPVKVAYNKAQLEGALMEFAEAKTDIVLIDTPGRGASETLSLAEMTASLRGVVDLTSYLVIPANLSASNFDSTIVRFNKVAKPDALILTKMDETADNDCLGFLINAQAKYQIPLAYVTNGPRVPDDLLVADAHVLIDKLISPC